MGCDLCTHTHPKDGILVHQLPSITCNSCSIECSTPSFPKDRLRNLRMSKGKNAKSQSQAEQCGGALQAQPLHGLQAECSITSHYVFARLGEGSQKLGRVAHLAMVIWSSERPREVHSLHIGISHLQSPTRHQFLSLPHSHSCARSCLLIVTAGQVLYTVVFPQLYSNCGNPMPSAVAFW